MIAGFVALALLTLGAIATYAMMGPGGMWDIQQMHDKMMGGGVDNSGAQQTQGSTQQSIEIRDFTFTPGNVEVPLGATVTWTNYDSAPHSATADDGSWDTGILDKGQSASVTFSSPGEYAYYCAVHPSMKAHIRVG